ncbi:MAG: hypothetical protein JWQ81_856 [Amycolatopsis sp.]|uniref:hypothetical protein n=1 Tax=Amycolatopsis sp. TaxID=37632 RepID=UPI002605B2CE|nr:hypothetical protein [Amycolatopsis sp.]MCU1680117.1 hypothetical protein [Amycolatopsis sp.]
MKKAMLLSATAVMTAVLALSAPAANALAADPDCSPEFPGFYIISPDGNLTIQYNGLRAFVGSQSGTMEFDAPKNSYGEYNASPSGGEIPISGIPSGNGGTWDAYVYNYKHIFACHASLTVASGEEGLKGHKH